ncbi:hypothetical protein chiPu_0025468, partial [Chiloscyllium punctatum]|nr:hypothetical protein [Chiloscyllium punctatum]
MSPGAAAAMAAGPGPGQGQGPGQAPGRIAGAQQQNMFRSAMPGQGYP